MKYIIAILTLVFVGACSITDSGVTAFQDSVKGKTYVWTKTATDGSISTTDFTFDQDGNLSFPVGAFTHKFNFESIDSSNMNRAYYLNSNMMGLGKVYAGLDLNGETLSVYYGTGRPTDPLTDTKESITWLPAQLKHKAEEKK